MTSIFLVVWLLFGSAQYVPGEMLISFNDEMGKHMAQEACKAKSATVMLTGDDYLDQLGREKGLIGFECSNLPLLCARLNSGGEVEKLWVAKFSASLDIEAIAGFYTASEHVRYAHPNYLPKQVDGKLIDPTSIPVLVTQYQTQYVPGQIFIYLDGETGRRMASRACTGERVTKTGNGYLDCLGKEHGLKEFHNSNPCKYGYPTAWWVASFPIDTDVEALAKLYEASSHVSSADVVPIAEPASGSAVEQQMPAVRPVHTTCTLDDDYQSTIARLLLPGLLCVIATVGGSAFVWAFGVTLYRRFVRRKLPHN